MSACNHNGIIKCTGQGEIRVKPFYTPDEIRTLEFDAQFGKHAHFTSLYSKRESLENYAGLEDSNVVLAVTESNHIIGYGVLAYPDPDERWIKVGSRSMMEIKAMEVCRGWRSTGVSKSIVQMMLAIPNLEEKIVYLVGYSWTWDLDATKRSAQEYRRLLIHLFSPYGFQEYQTNEPNICLKPENIFMGRVGNNVSRDIQKQFKWVRFGIYSSS